jgi:mannose-1-phosphate guanylyltransferase/phosphomannomutase
MTHVTVPTAWESKGLVMRSLVEQMSEQRTVLIDGVKVLEDGGWALLLPDPEAPVTHIWAEGSSGEEATARAGRYAELIANLLA